MDTQTYGIYIALIGVFATVVIPLLVLFLQIVFQMKKRSLNFKEIQNISVINIDDDFKDKIEMKYIDKFINSLFVLTANIENNGNIPIKKSDIVVPINISFKEKFIECTIIEVDPKGIEVNLNVNKDENSVECDFNLLNPHDYFTLQFISLERLSIPTITSRIDDLSNINIISKFNKGSFESESYNFENSSSKHSFIHNVILRILVDIEYRRPHFYFTIPGLCMLIIGYITLIMLLLNYPLNASLDLMLSIFLVSMFALAGLLMRSTGFLLHSISGLIRHIK